MERDETWEDHLPLREAANAAGMTVDAFTKQRTRGTAPPYDGKFGSTKWWHRSTIEAWAATFPRNTRRRPVDRDQVIAAVAEAYRACGITSGVPPELVKFIDELVDRANGAGE